jgi:hypothetical protein
MLLKDTAVSLNKQGLLDLVPRSTPGWPRLDRLRFVAEQGRLINNDRDDLEDLIAIVDGRADLVNEIHAGPEDVRAYIATEISKLLATKAFLDGLPGYLLPDPASQTRVSILLDRLKKIAAI